VRVVVGVNERGRRIGETHHNALISDAQVDRMRDRHEDDGLGYRKIAREFGVALTTVRKICTYERRAQTPDRWKTIRFARPRPVAKPRLLPEPKPRLSAAPKLRLDARKRPRQP
jgi:hypothetical protein